MSGGEVPLTKMCGAIIVRGRMEGSGATKGELDKKFSVTRQTILVHPSAIFDSVSEKLWPTTGSEAVKLKVCS